MEVSLAMKIPYEYMCKVAYIESNFNPNARNPVSSARGLYQFINVTESVLRTKYGVRGNIFDARVNATLMAYLVKDNGIMDSYTSMYLMHFLGKSSYNKIAYARDTDLIKDICPRAYYFNKELIGNKTKKEFIEYIEEKLEQIKGCTNG